MESRMSKLEQSVLELRQSNEMASSKPYSFESAAGAYSNEEIVRLRKEILEEMVKMEERSKERLRKRLSEQYDSTNRDLASIQSQFQLVESDKGKQDEKMTEIMIYAEKISQGLHELQQVVKEKPEKYEVL